VRSRLPPYDPLAGTVRKASRQLGLAALAVMVALLVAGCTPTPVTTEGRSAQHAYNIFLIAAAVVFIVVAVWLLWSVVAYRRRDDELPKQTHGNNKLELVWTAVPLALVLFLFVITLRAQHQILADPPARVNVDITGFQWSWEFDYEGTSKRIIGSPGQIPELVVPVGVPIHMKLRSADVVHSFYVPQALFKRQAIPGLTTDFEMNFQKVGVYHGQCALYCGFAHAQMLFRIKVVSQDQFDRFLSSGRGGAPTGGGT
jgi:cytochrome c oxidase subunit II